MNICYIQARGGSKRFPRKNLAYFNGVPMVVDAIRKAKASKCFDIIAVSSDDPEILQHATSEAVLPLWRTPLASNDEATDDDVVREVLRYFPKAKMVMKLYPCVPLLTVEDIQWLHGAYILSSGHGHYLTDQDGTDAGEAYMFAADEYKKLGTIALKSFPWVKLKKDQCKDINTPEDLDEATRIWRAREMQ